MKVTLWLTGQEGLILFDVLYRWDGMAEVTALFEHNTEDIVLWRVLDLVQAAARLPKE